MELVVRKADLLRELNLLQGIVERKVTIAVLANVLMEADGGELKLAATDLDVGLRSRCEASVSKPGTLTVPAKRLFDIVRALPDTDIRIEEDRAGMKIAAERFESRMSTVAAEEFPTLPAGADTYHETFTAASFRRMIKKTQFAITGEDTRYYLNGGLLVLRPERMTFVTTDGHRLALVTVPRGDEAAEKAGKTEDVILPRKTLSELDRILGDADADLQYGRGENHLFFRLGQRLLISRVIDGQFPAYERVIPRNNDKSVNFDRDRLMQAVKRVGILSNERSRAVKLQVEPGQVEINSSTPDVGDAREVIQVEYDGPAMQLCFNGQYIQDFLSAVETEQVSLEFKDDVSQAVMRPVDAEGYEYTYVIMPMRL